MSMSLFVMVAAGALAVIGLVGMVLGVAAHAEVWRHRLFRWGCYALTTSGVILMLTNLVGWTDRNELFGGLAMAVFGTGASLAPRKKAGAPASDEPAG